MYFYCPLLKVTQLVMRCEGKTNIDTKKRKLETCKTCTEWDRHTALTLPKEETESAAVESLVTNPMATPEEVADKERVRRLLRFHEVNPGKKRKAKTT